MEEQRAQIARDEEIARQWDEEERKRAMDEAKTTKKIDWNDPSVIRYHSLKMKPKTIAQARGYDQIFEEHKGKLQDKGKGEVSGEVVKELVPKRKKSIPKKSTRKRQKMEEDTEKEDLKEFLDIIPVRRVPYKKGDGSSKNYKIFTEMLRDFDRHDVEELYSLVKERYRDSRPEGYDLMLWGDLHTIFEPNADDELWKNLHQYNLLSWSLYDFCGIHMLLMENGMAIHMLTEKKYPLSQEMISKMLRRVRG
ncbi:hypothetical protein Tco_1318071 [Tanacetum coccineum]